MEVAKVETSQEVVRPLRMLVPLIKEDLDGARAAEEAAGMPYRRAAGEKLIEAKAQLKHGEFTPWIKRNLGIGERQAREYMNLARATTGISEAAIPFSSMRETISKTRNNPNYGKPSAWHAPIKEAIGRVNIDALKQDALAKQEERALQRKLALSLIDIGFKALAAKLHPDKGGSREAMIRLNRVRELLQGAVT
jgi:hypothetical protein